MSLFKFNLQLTTHPVTSSMLFLSLLIERGKVRFIGLGVSQKKGRIKLKIPQQKNLNSFLMATKIL